MLVRFLFVDLPVPVLTALDLICLFRLPKERRKGLLSATAALAVSSAVLFLGEWALNRFDLTWRMWPKEILCMVVWAAGLTAGILTVGYVGRCAPEGRRWLRMASRAFAAVCLVIGMVFMSFVGMLWAIGPGEQVITYKGEKVLQGTWTWMGEISYDLYAYHGPLVRGKEPLICGREYQPYLDEGDVE